MDPHVTAIIHRASGPMEWGVDDCVLFAADVAAAFLGFDPAAEYRGEWDSEQTAARALEARGGMARAVFRFMRDWTRVERAERGCLALVDTQAGLALAAGAAPGWLVMRAGEGVAFFEDGRARRIWKCPQPC